MVQTGFQLTVLLLQDSQMWGLQILNQLLTHVLVRKIFNLSCIENEEEDVPTEKIDRTKQWRVGKKNRGRNPELWVIIW